MKRWSPIGLLLVLAGLWSCAKPSVVPVSQELAAIDTLMQSRPDSALMLLVDTTMDDPYYQLLLSEALYKNDNPQLNRDELLEAMAWFDSVVEARPRDKDAAFLDARCHYMNGVGYYEMDSVVPACAEYLKAGEIMETYFEEKDLVGYKAKFMGLIYTRLTDLFSNQYLNEEAIHFGKLSIKYVSKSNNSIIYLAWSLEEIGSNYDILGQLDSAYYYYTKAINVLHDTTGLLHRDLSARLAFLMYKTTSNPEEPLKKLYRLSSLSESKRECLARCASIGEIYYHELQFDSAWKYLNKVFVESERTNPRKQAAEWLVLICDEKSLKDEQTQYALFLAPFANTSENTGFVKSQLTELFVERERNVQKKTHLQRITLQKKRLLFLLVFCFIAIIVVVIFSVTRKRKERDSHEKEIDDLTEKWEKAQFSLLKQKEASAANEKKKKADSFVEEPICKYILELVKEQNFKSNIHYSFYSKYALDNNQLLELRNAANIHYNVFMNSLLENYPKLTKDDLDYCCLYLLGLKEADVSALMQRTFSTVCFRSRKLKMIFNTKECLPIALHNMINM